MAKDNYGPNVIWIPFNCRNERKNPLPTGHTVDAIWGKDGKVICPRCGDIMFYDGEYLFNIMPFKTNRQHYVRWDLAGRNFHCPRRNDIMFPSHELRFEVHPFILLSVEAEWDKADHKYDDPKNIQKYLHQRLPHSIDNWDDYVNSKKKKPVKK